MKGSTSLRDENCIIAAGSEPVRLPGFPDDPRIIDSTGALALDDLPERMLVHEALELSRQLAGSTQPEFGSDAVLHGRQALLLEAGDRRGSERLVGERLQRVAPPQRQGLVEDDRRRGRVGGHEGPALGCERLQPASARGRRGRRRRSPPARRRSRQIGRASCRERV